MDKGKFRAWCLPLLLSCVLHAPLLYVFFEPAAENRSEIRQKLTVQLVSEKNPRDRDQEMAGPRAAPGLNAPHSAASAETSAMTKRSTLSALQRPKSKLNEAVADARLQKILKQIRKKIIAHWEDAKPPALGLVSLEIEILSSGKMSSKWITDLQGPSELGDYMVGLLDAIAFSDLSGLKGLSRPLRIECTFTVTGKSSVPAIQAKPDSQ